MDERTLAITWLDYTCCLLFWPIILAGLSNGVTAKRINETTNTELCQIVEEKTKEATTLSPLAHQTARDTVSMFRGGAQFLMQSATVQAPEY